MKQHRLLIALGVVFLCVTGGLVHATTHGTDTAKYFTFADSLKLGAEAFVWSNAAAKPPVSLATMSKPSHLHVTWEGLIVKTWAGIPEKIGTP